jgi:hypothetical protein
MKKILYILFFLLCFYKVEAQIDASNGLDFYFNFWNYTDSLHSNFVSFENIEPYNGKPMPKSFNMNLYINCPSMMMQGDSIDDFEVSLVLKFKLGETTQCEIPLNPRISRDTLILVNKKAVTNNDLKVHYQKKDTLVDYYIPIENIEILKFEKEYNKDGLLINQLLFYIYIYDIKTKKKSFSEYIFPICCKPQDCHK